VNSVLVFTTIVGILFGLSGHPYFWSLTHSC